MQNNIQESGDAAVRALCPGPKQVFGSLSLMLVEEGAPQIGLETVHDVKEDSRFSNQFLAFSSNQKYTFLRSGSSVHPV